jgi:hypothetical protein
MYSLIEFRTVSIMSRTVEWIDLFDLNNLKQYNNVWILIWWSVRNRPVVQVLRFSFVWRFLLLVVYQLNKSKVRDKTKTTIVECEHFENFRKTRYRRSLFTCYHLWRLFWINRVCHDLIVLDSSCLWIRSHLWFYLVIKRLELWRSQHILNSLMNVHNNDDIIVFMVLLDYQRIYREGNSRWSYVDDNLSNRRSYSYLITVWRCKHYR